MNTSARPLYIARIATTGAQFDAPPDQPLLVSAEQALLNWPSSCRNGTCRTCIGKLSTGQVRYEMDWPGLSAEEKSEGYVLPCVAYPLADVTLCMVDG